MGEVLNFKGNVSEDAVCKALTDFLEAHKKNEDTDVSMQRLKQALGQLSEEQRTELSSTPSVMALVTSLTLVLSEGKKLVDLIRRWIR